MRSSAPVTPVMRAISRITAAVKKRLDRTLSDARSLLEENRRVLDALADALDGRAIYRPAISPSWLLSRMEAQRPETPEGLDLLATRYAAKLLEGRMDKASSPGSQPVVSSSLLYRIAIHEAGHAVARIQLGIGLEGAYDHARKLVGKQREAVTYLASMIPFGRPLEGAALARVVKCARAKLVS